MEHESMKMSGFLEKKGKMKLVSPWKKYWFVLEERLLLYYKSRTDNANLKACKGSLNMGLVTTVRPGSSNGPCVIHIVTRTQAMQLRAKNRASQEKWLQALLYSMALPLNSSLSKLPTLKTNLSNYAASLDNVALNYDDKNINVEEDKCISRQKFNFQRRQIDGTYYGGSLDTAVWSKKFKPFHHGASSVKKGRKIGKMLRPALKNSETVTLTTSFERNSCSSVFNEHQMKYLNKNINYNEMVERRKEEKICKLHDENRNHDNSVEVRGKPDKKENKKTLGDNGVCKKEAPQNMLSFKIDKKRISENESPFERIKNALSRIPKDRSLNAKKREREKIPRFRKRRESFLQKIFRRKYSENQKESEENHSMLAATDHLVLNGMQHSEGNRRDSTKYQFFAISSDAENKALENQKILNGSNIKFSGHSLTETNLELKSGVALEKRLNFSDCEQELNDDVMERRGNDNTSAPSLPPRRISRPVSPWHDVPTNNAPIDSNKRLFFAHQAIVRFKDPLFLNYLDTDKTDFVNEDVQLDVTEPSIEPSNDFEEPHIEKHKNDDLSLLLEQLKQITVAPLAESECLDDNHSCSSNSSEKFYVKSNHSDPDYDIPRPHKPLNILISHECDFTKKYIDKSHRNLFQSIEPDSLETMD